MDIQIKRFYFVKDEFYKLINDSFLVSNKENGAEWPCFLAIEENNGIIWMIPVTSKATKFKEILNKKIKRYGICDTIVIGKLLGRECAFLIQNMFPITKYYIEKEYIQASNNVPVAIEDPLANEIIIKQKKVRLHYMRYEFYKCSVKVNCINCVKSSLQRIISYEII